ncbi:hypothetical protein CLOM_g674 [Closterium sp. NIES-68]|nr:hypothetical protein CLOM_g674 [Closterium sp. NIES-68]GJP69408.1 hypothetical protein CLOP_g338 [Closterium sp. NIES-67]
MYRHTALHHASCGKLSLPRGHVGRPLVPPHIPLTHSFQPRSRVALHVSAAAAASTPDPAGSTPLNAGARIAPRRGGEAGSACQNLIRQQHKRALRSEAHAVAAPDQYGVADSLGDDCSSCSAIRFDEDADGDVLQCFPDFVLDPSESDGSARLFRKSFSLHDAPSTNRYFSGDADSTEGYASMPESSSPSSAAATRFSSLSSSEAARPSYSSMSPRDAMPLHPSPASPVTDTSLVQPPSSSSASSSPYAPAQPQAHPPARVDELKQGAIRAIIRAEENYRQAFHALQEAQARLESTRLMAAEINTMPSLPPSPRSSPSHSPPASPMRSPMRSPSLSRSPSATLLETVDATLLDVDARVHVHAHANGPGADSAGFEAGLVISAERAAEGAAEPEEVVAMMDSLAAQRERSRESLRLAEQVLRDRLGEAHVQSQVIDHHIEMMDCGGQYHVAHWLVDKVQEIASASSPAAWTTANAARNGPTGAPVGAGAGDGNAEGAAPPLLAVPVNLDLAAQGYDDHAVRFLQHLPYGRVLKIRTIASDPPHALLPPPDALDAVNSGPLSSAAGSAATRGSAGLASDPLIDPSMPEGFVRASGETVAGAGGSSFTSASASALSAASEQQDEQLGATEAMPVQATRAGPSLSARQAGQRLPSMPPWANLLPGTVGWSPLGLLPAPPSSPAAVDARKPREARSRRARVSKRTAPAAPPADAADGGEASAEPVWLSPASFELAEAAAAALSQAGAGLAEGADAEEQWKRWREWKQWDPLDLASSTSSAFVKEFGDDDDDAYDARLVNMAMAAAADRGQEERERQAWMRMELLLVGCAALYMAWHCDAVSLAKDVYVLALGSGFAFLAAQFVGLLPQRYRQQLGVAGLEGGLEGMQGIRCPLLVHMAATSAGLGASADTLLAAGSAAASSAGGGPAGEVWREAGEGLLQEEGQQQQLDAKRHRTWEAAIEVIGLVSALLALSTVLALLIKSSHLLLSFLTSSLSHGVARGVQVLLTWLSASHLSALTAWSAAGWMSAATTAALPSSIIGTDLTLRGAFLPLSLSLTSAVALTLLLLFRPPNGGSSSQRA